MTNVDRQLKRLKAISTRILYFIRFFMRHYHATHGTQTASSLAYTTLLSIVPLLAVMFGVFGSIHILQEASIAMQDFIFSNFVPQFGKVIQGYISNYSSKASSLTITGIVALMIIALMLMATIDNALNRIWYVTKKRSPISRLLIYWAVLTMGPLLIGIGLASTSYLLSLPVIAGYNASFRISAVLLSWLPFLTTSVAFTLIYILIPNCFVPKKYALLCGVICAILFEIAKYWFGVYVRAMPTYQNIYGAVAIIPLFLIWIYVSWTIVLFGAYLSFCLTSFRLQDEIENRGKCGWRFIDALIVLEYLYQAQMDGHTVSIHNMRRQALKLPHFQMNDLMEALHRANWINQSSSGQWLLSKDMTELSLFDLHKILPVRLPLTEQELDDHPLSVKLKARLGNHNELLEQSLSASMATFLKPTLPDPARN